MLDRRVGEQSEDSLRYLRLPSQLRLRFEEELDKLSGKRNFKRIFEGNPDYYSQHITKAIKRVLTLREAADWFGDKGVEIITWHYKTRRPRSEVEIDPDWLTGQVTFARDLREAVDKEKLVPFSGKSPYIEIYSNERSRGKIDLGGPICILLPEENPEAPEEREIQSQWKGIALTVPSIVTRVLLTLPEHPGNTDPSLTPAVLDQIKDSDSGFVRELTCWMRNAQGKPVDELIALKNLLASLKVTLRLLKYYDRSLSSRSTFLAPAYVADEEVGGMAFACKGLVSMKTALVGDAVATTLLTYLRLREDALAHGIVGEQEVREQIRRFIIRRLVHDFRHPVDALQSSIRESVESLLSIEKQVKHIGQVMDETVFALEGREPRRALKARKRPDKVSEFIADIRYFFRGQFKEKGKDLEVSEVDPTWTFDIDRGMLHEIMGNLISNALEHGGQHVRIVVNLENEKYLIHVQDDGPGIPEEDRERIFRPFYKSSIYEKEGRIRGSGLAIAKMLAEAQGGTVRPGPGDKKWKTDFVIEIPKS
jgi:signal transduction histidine kinase